MTSWLYFFHSRKYFQKKFIGNGCVPDIVKGSGDAEVKRTQTFFFFSSSSLWSGRGDSLVKEEITVF